MATKKSTTSSKTKTKSTAKTEAAPKKAPPTDEVAPGGPTVAIIDWEQDVPLGSTEFVKRLPCGDYLFGVQDFGMIRLSAEDLKGS